MRTTTSTTTIWTTSTTTRSSTRTSTTRNSTRTSTTRTTISTTRTRTATTTRWTDVSGSAGRAGSRDPDRPAVAFRVGSNKGRGIDFAGDEVSVIIPLGW